MKVGIIDSGVSLSDGMPIEQYVVKETGIEKEEPNDQNGHGSSMFSIIKNSLNVSDDTALSLRLEVRKENLNFYIGRAIQFCIDKRVNIINISLGNAITNHIEYLSEICFKAMKSGILIVAAASNYGDFIFPWACSGVLRIRQGKDNDGKFVVKKDEFHVLNIYVNARRYGKLNRIVFGNSAATAFVVAAFCKYIKNLGTNGYDLAKLIEKVLMDYGSDISCIDDLLSDVSIIKGKVDFIGNDRKVNWGRCIIVPFSKEMDSIIRYGKGLKVILGSGGVRTALSKDSGIMPVTLAHDIKEYGIDSIIVGYLDKLKNINSEYSENNIVEYVIKNHLNVFSFNRFTSFNEDRLVKNHIHYQYANVISGVQLQQIRKVVPYRLLPHKPVVGVFGTSSKQGKFTCQLAIKEMLEKKHIKVNFIGTEHQSILVDSTMEYPVGYNAENTIHLNLEESIEFLQKSIFYIDQKIPGDLILFGSQSWLIPFDINRQTAIYNLAFLEATKPDYAILVVNPELDHDKYITDTINTLECVYKCKVISLAFSDMRPVSKNNHSFKVRRDCVNILETNQQLKMNFGKESGCIKDQKYIENIVDSLLALLNENGMR